MIPGIVISVADCFTSVLLDYYEATGDMDTLKDLYDVTIKQIYIAMTQLNEKNVVEDLGAL